MENVNVRRVRRAPRKLYIVFYVLGILWFCCLSCPFWNEQIGASARPFREVRLLGKFTAWTHIVKYHTHLNGEIRRSNGSMPVEYLMERMQQMGIQAYSHTFTLHEPFRRENPTRTGTNVYGILWAPRTAATTAIVLNVPFRPTFAANVTTIPSIAALLAFARHARQQIHWGKNVIFLITEHEEVGLQAWLEAYHSVFIGKKGILDHGIIRKRAGAIHSAINLELHHTTLTEVDLKIEGLNGQLPNLDLYYLAVNVLNDSYVQASYRQYPGYDFQNWWLNWQFGFPILMGMVAEQITGLPNGNHGIFQKFAIQSLTLESTQNRPEERITHAYGIMGRVLEDFMHSLDVNEQRFSLGQFFYLLATPWRFVKLRTYLICMAFFAAALLNKAGIGCLDICLCVNSFNPLTVRDVSRRIRRRRRVGDNIFPIIGIIYIGHIIGLLLLDDPYLICVVGAVFNYLLRVTVYRIPLVHEHERYEAGFTELAVCYGYLITSVLLVLIPFMIPVSIRERAAKALYTFAMIELVAILFGLAFSNISLALYCAVIYIPFVYMVGDLYSIGPMIWLMSHPLFVLLITVLSYTYVWFPDENYVDSLYRGLVTTHKAIVRSMEDFMIHGNWLYGFMVSVFIPNWVFFWIVAVTKASKENILNEED